MMRNIAELFTESLIKAGIAAGLPEATAKILAIHTLRDSTLLAERSTIPLAQLRKNVTSPGGTTEAALNVLMEKDALQSLIIKAVLV